MRETRNGGRRLAGAVVLSFALWPVSAIAAPSMTVSFTARDGVQISATYYTASRRPAPAVILLHMLTRTREDWEAAGNRLADGGMAVLAVDFRSRVLPGDLSSAGEDRRDFTPFVLDAQAARQFLSGRPEIVQTAIGIAGASIGANVAVLVAAADPSVRSLALLSPGIDYRGLRIDAAMRKYAERAALLIASEEDPYASRSVRQLSAIGNGRREMRMVNGAGHGTMMLTREPDLVALLVDWFSRTLS